jgi:hypothetical protein
MIAGKALLRKGNGLVFVEMAITNPSPLTYPPEKSPSSGLTNGKLSVAGSILTLPPI